jgi:nicotinamide-nucleotide amidase
MDLHAATRYSLVMTIPAAILSIGDELVSGVSVDTNSAWLAAQLAAVGIGATFHVTVGDDLAHIVEAIQQVVHAQATKDPAFPCNGGILLITGGLGPTEDDLTRQALADAMGEQLVEDPTGLSQIESWFKKVSRPMAASNRLQALRPQSAGILENTNGTAPGLRARFEQTEIFVMPGVPREMKEMYTRAILPALRERLAQHAGDTPAQVRHVIKINTFGTGESVIGEKIKDLMVRGGYETKGAHVSVGTTAADGIVSVRVYASGTVEATREAIDTVRAEVSGRLGPIIYGEGEETLEAAVGALLKHQKATIATAESCTGGMIAEMLTNIAGSSEYFLRGWVTYANESKQQELGVPAEMLAACGAVSEQVAGAMAEGARQHAGTQWAVSTTGIAGPGGGSEEKPVGTVWIAVTDGRETIARRFIFPGNRQQVRQRAAQMALALLRWRLMGILAPV